MHIPEMQGARGVLLGTARRLPTLFFLCLSLLENSTLLFQGDHHQGILYRGPVQK